MRLRPGRPAIRWLLVLPGLFISLSIGNAAAPIITAKHDDRILLGQGDVEMVVPIPSGYILTNHRRINYKTLPSLQERNMLAAFEKRVDKSNEYLVEPEAEQPAALYYLVYVPRLNYAAATSPDLLAWLEQAYMDYGFERVSETERIAILRPDEDALTVTWADLTQKPEIATALPTVSAANCLHTAAYRKQGMVVMFDTIATCGADAASVKLQGENWLQRIRSANEPLPYSKRLLAEKAAQEQQAVAAPEDPAASETADKAVTEPRPKAAHGTWSRILWLLGGAVFGILVWNLAGRLRASLQKSDEINRPT